MSAIRDIQHLLHAEGRAYVIEVCAPGANPAPVSAGPFDVHITVDIPSGFDAVAEEPEATGRHVIDYVRALVPASITPT